MGDEVKITVIATGFRDQMPERRARMLTVEEVPVVSVPIVAADNWMREPATMQSMPAPSVTVEETAVDAPVPASEPAAPPAPRFMSQDEDMEEDMEEDMDEPAEDEEDEPAFVAASSPAQPAMAASSSDVERFEQLFADQETARAHGRPRFAELNEDPVYTPLPRDYATDLGNGLQPASAPAEHRSAPASLFAENQEQTERDLEVPAFMRRMQF